MNTISLPATPDKVTVVHGDAFRVGSILVRYPDQPERDFAGTTARWALARAAGAAALVQGNLAVDTSTLGRALVQPLTLTDWSPLPNAKGTYILEIELVEMPGAFTRTLLRQEIAITPDIVR